MRSGSCLVSLAIALAPGGGVSGAVEQFPRLFYRGLCPFSRLPPAHPHWGLTEVRVLDDPRQGHDLSGRYVRDIPPPVLPADLDLGQHLTRIHSPPPSPRRAAVSGSRPLDSRHASSV